MAEMTAATIDTIEIGSIFVYECLQCLVLKLKSMIAVHEPLRKSLGQTKVVGEEGVLVHCWALKGSFLL